MSIFLMRSFNSSTRGDDCGVSCVINSCYEFGIKLICYSLFLVFVDSFIIALISLFMLTTLILMNSFMISFIRYFTSTMIDSLRSFIMSDTWSFQFTYHSELESIVMSSWVSRAVVLWGPLSMIVDHPGISCNPLPIPRRLLSWSILVIELVHFFYLLFPRLRILHILLCLYLQLIVVEILLS